MKLDRSFRYVFMSRDAAGAELIGVREWNGRAWKTRRMTSHIVTGSGSWAVLLSPSPLWRGGPRMVLEVPA